jgi:acyl-lipid omega-6 desaturase (Delta-12 desaturase)
MHDERAGVVAHRSTPDWFAATSKYARPSLRKAIWQVLNTFIPYVAIWALMIHMVQQGYPYWITFALVVVAAALLVRVFILFHDCCHGSFFASRRANVILGYVSGILTFTPYDDWRRSHIKHHATSGDLDRRGAGDVWTMTVAEYLAASRRERLRYRLFRNPFVLFGLGPAYKFFFARRFSYEKTRDERRSVIITNTAVAGIIGVASLSIGIQTYLAIQVPVMLIAGTVGFWLFYVQHQYEWVYWARHEAWDPMRAALKGSSYYKLPKVLQWFTGNIGLHHVHHVRPRIPNYHLQRCHDEIPALQAIEPLTLRRSFKSLWLNLWDEKQQKMVSFRSLKAVS